jgi:hypothetical protein
MVSWLWLEAWAVMAWRLYHEWQCDYRCMCSGHYQETRLCPESASVAGNLSEDDGVATCQGDHVPTLTCTP